MGWVGTAQPDPRAKHGQNCFRRRGRRFKPFKTTYPHGGRGVGTTPFDVAALLALLASRHSQRSTKPLCWPIVVFSSGRGSWHQHIKDPHSNSRGRGGEGSNTHPPRTPQIPTKKSTPHTWGGRLQPVLIRPTPWLSFKTCGGGGRGGGGGGSAGGCGGGTGGSAGGGGVPKVGGLRATHYYHMHTSWGDVCLGVWGYGGMYVIIALSHLCQEESLKGRRGKHAQKRLSAVGTMPPNPLSRAEGGLRGGRIQGPSPAAPPGAHTPSPPRR